MHPSHVAVIHHFIPRAKNAKVEGLPQVGGQSVVHNEFGYRVRPTVSTEQSKKYVIIELCQHLPGS